MGRPSAARARSPPSGGSTKVKASAHVGQRVARFAARRDHGRLIQSKQPYHRPRRTRHFPRCAGHLLLIKRLDTHAERREAFRACRGLHVRYRRACSTTWRLWAKRACGEVPLREHATGDIRTTASNDTSRTPTGSRDGPIFSCEPRDRSSRAADSDDHQGSQASNQRRSVTARQHSSRRDPGRWGFLQCLARRRRRLTHSCVRSSRNEARRRELEEIAIAR